MLIFDSYFCANVVVMWRKGSESSCDVANSVVNHLWSCQYRGCAVWTICLVAVIILWQLVNSWLKFWLDRLNCGLSHSELLLMPISDYKTVVPKYLSFSRSSQIIGWNIRANIWLKFLCHWSLRFISGSGFDPDARDLMGMCWWQCISEEFFHIWKLLACCVCCTPDERVQSIFFQRESG